MDPQPSIANEQDPGLIQRLSTFLKQGIMSPREAQETFERMSPPPQIINLPGETEAEQAAKERILRLYAQDLPIREIVDAMAMEGYNADTLLHGRARVAIGYDPGAEVAEPMHTFRAEAAEDLKVGEAVMVDGDGNARRALEGEQVIGVHLGDGNIRFTGGRMNMRANRGSVMGYGSMVFHASIAYGVFDRNRTLTREPPGQRVDAPAFKYTERFPKEVEAKAMELLRKFMSPEQYEAFVDRADIELENKAGDTRLIINQNGGFTMMKGDRGAGIVLTSGNVRSYRFPLGDEIAAFLDWFRYKTPELIQNWNCGNFGIVRDGIE